MSMVGKTSSNFDFLDEESEFRVFANIAKAAEGSLKSDPTAAVGLCRRALEMAIKWMYSIDSSLPVPWDDGLSSLISTDEFRQMVGEVMRKRVDYVRKLGDQAAQIRRRVSVSRAILCLECLHRFLRFVASSYSTRCTDTDFNQNLALNSSLSVFSLSKKDPSLEELREQNAHLQEELTATRVASKVVVHREAPDFCEFATRKLFIDTMLIDAGWEEGSNWLNEVELPGMPNNAGLGYADYVLYGNNGKALAVIEAKRTSVSVEKGRQQAKLYADILERQQGLRPVVFLSNGFVTKLIDNQYPERRVSSVYSQRDLEKLFNLQTTRCSLLHTMVDNNIAGRYYQKEAIRAACETFEGKHRKALLVMATGSGKTRTVIALCKILMEMGWVTNILFLADRTSLVTQAKRAFTNMLPELSLVNLVEDKDNMTARCVFSTYNTMMNCIDASRDRDGKKLFTCGHFDLVICDEAHRSIYNKYKDIFNYFDAPLIGLTATPKDEIDKNTYEIFDLEEGVPTYGYDLSQAVKDGYLVNYQAVETVLKFMSEGITYDSLSEKEKEKYEDTFTDEDGNLPDSINASALNNWVFNTDTIRQVLNILMTQGRRVDYGNKIGKTIIFAKSHAHAEKILEVFNLEYPHLHHQAQVIDNYINYAQSAIDEFSDRDKMPQIAITVDMLDTGIDVPEVLNLVFFKKVMSKAKFWQMIGRGTRLCPGLVDGEDKDGFTIFDFCGNFEFFRISKGSSTPNALPLQGALFVLKARIVSKLQDLAYQTDFLRDFRARLVDEMLAKVQELNRENFAVRQHLEAVVRYARPDSYQGLTPLDIMTIQEELAPLIAPETDEITALRFDALMYGAERAYLEGAKRYLSRALKDMHKKVAALATVANIPAVYAKRELLEQILHTDFVQHAQVNDLERIRQELRDLMKYLPHDACRYDTDFRDEILSQETGKPMPGDDTLTTYREKAAYYLKRHQDQAVISKLKHNIPLSKADVKELEKILWGEIGSQSEYEREFAHKPLGEFVREIVGLDMNAAKEAFARFLDESTMNSRQIYFVNKIVDFIVLNGMMKDLSVLQEDPFNKQGSIVELFGDDLETFSAIRSTINSINTNALAA